MGKGRIISAHGEGRYTIEIVEDRARAESARALAVQRVAELDGRIADLDSQISAAQAGVDAAADEQDAAIEQYRLDMEGKGESDVDLTARAQAVLDAARERDSLRTRQRLLEVQRDAAQSRIDRIDALPPPRQIDAWCADYTEDLSGEVATAEVPGEIGQVIIKPGFSDGAAWSASADGAIQPALAGTPASVFYNLAMLPGWQRWRPTFRIATISNINNDLCDITLDPATSSQQSLPANAQGSYTGVPIMYMDCNGGAFEDGDRALVAFSGSTDQPMVVGFEQEPKECADRIYIGIYLTIWPWEGDPGPDGKYNADGWPIMPGEGASSYREDVTAYVQIRPTYNDYRGAKAHVQSTLPDIMAATYIPDLPASELPMETEFREYEGNVLAGSSPGTWGFWNRFLYTETNHPVTKVWRPGYGELEITDALDAVVFKGLPEWTGWYAPENNPDATNASYSEALAVTSLERVGAAQIVAATSLPDFVVDVATYSPQAFVANKGLRWADVDLSGHSSEDSHASYDRPYVLVIAEYKRVET